MDSIQRFWSKVDKRGACWNWTASRMVSGYGVLKFRGRTCGAHRVAYELTHGPIPDGMVVMHSCDNPSCVNPAHLSLGTICDNMRDMYAKGRRGPRFAATAEIRKEARAHVVIRLKEIATARGLSIPQLHRLTGIPEGTVRRLWKNEVNFIDISTLGQLMLALDVTPGDLLTRP